MRNLDYATLNPGIRNTVKWIRETLCLDTCDSGDGSTHEYACDRVEPYVVIVSTPASLVQDAKMLRDALVARGVHVSPIGAGVLAGAVFIQASYDPADDVSLIDLNGVIDAMLKD